MGSARAAPNFSGSGARVSGSGWGAGRSLPLAPARAAPMSLRGMGRRPLPCEGTMNCGRSWARAVPSLRRRPEWASENAKSGGRRRNRGAVTVFEGCVGVRGVVAAVRLSVICRSGGRSSPERAAPGRAAPPGRVSPCPSAPLPRYAPPRARRLPQQPYFWRSGEIVATSHRLSALPLRRFTRRWVQGRQWIWRLLSLACKARSSRRLNEWLICIIFLHFFVFRINLLLNGLGVVVTACGLLRSQLVARPGTA